ncbi:MAG: hypothetical protein ACXW02_08765 [Halobacteriota archaeon]
MRPEQNDRSLTSIMAMFFDPPLSKNEGTYKFRHVAAQADSMAGLVSEGMDFGWHQSGQSAEIDVSDFVIRIPRQFGKITLDDLEENIGRIPYEKRPNVVLGNTPGSWRKGREMTAVELEPYQAGDFRCVGWRATQMKSGDRMGMILTRASTP